LHHAAEIDDLITAERDIRGWIAGSESRSEKILDPLPFFNPATTAITNILPVILCYLGSFIDVIPKRSIRSLQED
jgi:hypothetical protein